MAINHQERAGKAWPVLVECAKNKKTIRYKSIASKIGVHHRAVGHLLSCIQDYCLDEKLPPLTILVVGASGVPGDGFIAWDAKNLSDGLNKVYGFNWSDYPNPFAFAINGDDIDSVAGEIVANPGKSKEYYARVKVRGIAQQIFRQELLQAYNYECCISQISFQESLDAAHIVPWSDSSDSEKLDPRNGILLNSFHHRLFDAGYITIDEEYRVVYCDPKMKDGPYSEMDKKLTVDLNRNKISLPNDKSLWPSKDAIKKRNEIFGWKL